MKKRTIFAIVIFLLFSIASFNLKLYKSELKMVSGELKSSPKLNEFLENIGALESMDSLKTFFGVGEEGSIREVVERIEPFTDMHTADMLRQIDHINSEIMKKYVHDYNDLNTLLRGTYFAAGRTLSLKESFGPELHDDVVHVLMMLGKVENDELADEFALRIGTEGDLIGVKNDLLNLENNERTDSSGDIENPKTTTTRGEEK